MKRNKVLFVVLALVVALSIGLLVACDNDEACEHEYGPYALTVAPTDMLEGQAVHICSKCGYAETVVVPALTNEEVWAAVTTSATHESDGHTTYTSIYGVTTVTVGRLTDHVYDKEVEDARYLKSAADCENAAVYYKTCICGAVGTDTFTSGEATGHTYVDDAGYPATCTTDGITAGKHCSVCGKVEVAQTVIPATQKHIAGPAATCTSDQVCLVCGAVLDEAHHTWSTDCKLVYEESKYWNPDSGDEEVSTSRNATDYHAHYCTVCGLYNTDEESEHTYGAEYIAVEKDHNGHQASIEKACTACGYIKVVNSSYGYLEYGDWTEGETKAANYKEDGYTVYTRSSYTYTLVKPKLVAPYLNKTYDGFTFTVDSAEPNEVISTTAWSNNHIALDADGKGTSTYSPLQGVVTISPTTGTATDNGQLAVTISVAKESTGRDGTKTTTTVDYNGYVDLDTGMILFSYMYETRTIYVALTPYGEATYKDLNASTWNYDAVTAVAVSYYVHCDIGYAHSKNILVNDDDIYFDVAYVGFDGAALEAKDCYNHSFIAKDAGGNAIYTWAYDGESQHTADGYQGAYRVDLGEGDVDITLSGCGTFVLADDTVGTYALVADADYTADMYILGDGDVKTAYYRATISKENNSIEVTKPTATIKFNVGADTEGVADATANLNIAYTLPVPTSNDHMFSGWYTDSAYTEDSKLGATYTVTSESEVTLYAKWVNKVTLSVHDSANGDKLIDLPAGAQYEDYLPNYTVGTFYGDKIFVGWYADSGYESPFEKEGSAPSETTTVNVYAKYDQAGTWEITLNTSSSEYPFEYNDGEWTSTNKGKPNSQSVMIIKAVDGPIHVTFKYWASSENASKYDYLEIYYDTVGSDNRSSVTAGGTTMTVADAKDFDVVIPAGKSVDIKYKKDGTSNAGADTAYIINLRINDIKIVNTAGKDTIAGTYTSDGNPDLKLNGYGTALYDNAEGAYNEVTGADYNVLATIGGKVYKITLSGSTYTMVEYKVSVTYKYLNDVTADVTEEYYYGKSLTLKEIGDVTNGEKTFVGWFSKDGTNDDWGTQIEDGTKVTADMIVYAKWVEPHEMMGAYKGGYVSLSSYSISSSSVTASKDLTIDALGVLSGLNDGYVATYTNGSVTISNGSTTYAGAASTTDGIFVKQYTAENNYSWYVFVRIDGEVSVQSIYYVGFDVPGTFAMLYSVTYSDNTTKYAFMQNGVLYGSVTWTATDSTGTAITDITKLKDSVKFITVTSGDKSFAYAKYSSYMKLCDGMQGTYTCDGKSNVVLDGVGGITYGSATGTYTAASATAGYGYDVKVSENSVYKTYKLTIDVANKTYTIEDNLVTITYVNDKLGNSSVQVYYNVYTKLKDDASQKVSGFKFLGWFESETAASNRTSVTPTKDMTYYARYAEAVVLTFDYNGQGTAAVTVDEKYVGDKVSGIPTVASDVKYGDKVFAGWFLKDADGNFTDEASTSTVLKGNLTYYAKWVVPHALAGTYYGYEFDTSYFRTTKKTLVVDILGNAKFGTEDYGAVTYTESTGLVTFSKNSRYAYYDAASETFRINYSLSAATSFGTDTYVVINASNVSNSSSDIIRWEDSKYQLGIMTVDGVKKYFYLTPERVYGNVTVSATLSGTAVTDITKFAVTETVVKISDSNGTELITVAYNGTTFVGSDGKNGTYTAADAYGDLVVDGYGNVTVGGTSVTYTLDGDNITFIANNAMRTVALGTGTYTKVQDGYQGEYTLPDSSDALALDGYGNVTGTTKTYVVNSSNITIYDGESSVTYGIDVANHAFLGKSKFAGYTFTGTYYDEYDEKKNDIQITFDDGTAISGIFETITYPQYKIKFTATFDGKTLIMTLTENVQYAGDWVGKTITATLAGKTFTITDCGCKSNSGAYSFANQGALTCADYVG